MICIKNQKLKIVLTLVITLIGLLSPFFDCFGVFYAEEFPSEIGLAGGYFVKIRNSLGNNVHVVLIPENYINSFTVQGNGELINLTANTISTRSISISTGNTVNARFTSLGGLQYLGSNGYSWEDQHYTILDMNIYPKSSDPDYANQNLHLSYDTRHLVIVLFFATLLIILFRSVKRD